MMMNELMEITEKVFGQCKTVWNDSVKRRAIVCILCLRLEGRCSIISISQIRRRFGILKYSSVGSVSEILQFAGECLPNTLVNEQGGARLVIMACDENILSPLPSGPRQSQNIYQTYLLRDVKDLIDIADDYKMQTLVKALSIQIGNILSYQELSASVGVSFQTLKKYLNFLEKTFILYRIPPYYRNKRTELVKNPKIYFGDTGLRNAVLNDFRRMDIRVDKGALYENFHFSEYLKEGITPRFWRTKSGAEVDFVIEEYEKLFPIEIKGRLKASPSGLPISPSFRSFMTKYRPERGFVYNDEVSRRQGDVFFLPHWAHYPIY